MGDEDYNLANVDDPDHAALIRDIIQFCEKLGAMVISSDPYHEHLPREQIDRLAQTFDPTAIYVRTRDDLTILPINNESFLASAKTHKNQKYVDLTIELFPFLIHQMICFAGVKVLYAVRHPVLQKDFGFWANNHPLIREFRLTLRDRQEHPILIRRIRELIRLHYPQTRIIEEDRYNRGGGDSYLIIDGSNIYNLPDWRVLIESFIRNEEN